MTRTRFGRLWLAAAAVAAAIPALRSEVSATTGPTKNVACSLVGCSKGTQKCADVQAELSDPLVGKLSVTWYCYEPGGPEDDGLGEGGGEAVI
jgi:hypothetical protein